MISHNTTSTNEAIIRSPKVKTSQTTFAVLLTDEPHIFKLGYH